MRFRKLLPLLILMLTSCGTGSMVSSADNDVSSVSGSSSSIVVYFSATSNTKGIAEKIKTKTESDIYEIVPKVAYTSEDLNYNDFTTRATKEQNDDSARPEIGSADIDLSPYSLIYLGYPIWWGQAPKIMYTFVEKYSLKDKTIIPFVTSGSSSIGSSATNLAKASDGGDWKAGRRFSASASDEEISSFLSTCLD